MVDDVSSRPFGVSLLSILIIVAGALDVVAGILSVSVRDDDQLLIELKGTRNEFTAFGIGLIILGVIAIVVSALLWRGSRVARILIGIIALVRLAGTVWAFASFSKEHWYEGIGTVVIYGLVAWYLLLGQGPREYTSTA